MDLLQTLFVDVVLPLPLPQLYSYRVPLDLNTDVAVGKRVVVQFGKQKLYTALIRKVNEKPPVGYEAKYILSVLDDIPVVSEKQFAFWEWMCDYYMCFLGEVMNAALPGGLKLESKTMISLNPDFDETSMILPDHEFQVVESLRGKDELSADEISKLVGVKSVFALIRSLISKGVVELREELNEKYKAKKIKVVKLAERYEDDDEFETMFEKLDKRAPKQADLLVAYHKIRIDLQGRRDIKQDELLKLSGASSSLLSELAKKGILEISEKEVDRLWTELAAPVPPKILNDFQTVGIAETKKWFEENDKVLMHGVTSSGKTEIYIHLIEETIAQGKQVLYLLPEIALTSQIINRLRKHFGNDVQVYHSKLGSHERVEVWQNLLKPAPFSIILSARSGIFLPFTNIGLIIVDEEHDTSFKQYDPAPRYNARDAAVVLASMHHAKVLLGSATPSLESYRNAKLGKYGLVNMTQRFGGLLMPEIEIIDIKDATKRKLMKSHFSPRLLEGIKTALDNKEQIILFQNRRGYAPVLECTHCSWIPRCKNCDVSLTYHKATDQLRCHYCGFSQPPPTKCLACGDATIRMKGFGTEKIEDELSVFFPDAKIGRLDLDTTHSKLSYHKILGDFEDQKIDILVGTQMVTKGLDFDHVSTVGILNADNLMNFPDFRAYERAYQLMSQVSGRAGRKKNRGKVIIQTYNPSHSIIQHVVLHDYARMAEQEFAERRRFMYPPYCRLILLTLKHKEIHEVESAAANFAFDLKKLFGENVMGPQPPLVSRIRNLFLRDILIKIPNGVSIHETKQKIREKISSFRSTKENRSVVISIDVDPY